MLEVQSHRLGLGLIIISVVLENMGKECGMCRESICMSIFMRRDTKV